MVTQTSVTPSIGREFQSHLFSDESSDILMIDRPREKLELPVGGMEVPRTGTEDREEEEEGGMDIPRVGTEVVLREM